MVFSSILFIFYFLPLTLLLYYAGPSRLRNLVLLVMSLEFRRVLFRSFFLGAVWFSMHGESRFIFLLCSFLQCSTMETA